MQDDLEQDGLFARWRTRLSQALLREPAIVLLERDADALIAAREEPVSQATLCESVG
ncbi:hypothetical protein ACFOKF_04985 [Sphingobium rhizovicinum]|jgi:hypothetical protein|uniref:Uncharacterized protein n=1 Tax=Sphingobium rhizovicinum TaxID=432308 RepID=A0ABV7NCV5_9SPHN